MLQRDYFIRIIQEFMAALALFLEKKEGKAKDDELRDLYRQYVGDYDILRNLSFEEMLVYARDQWKEEERMERLEMLAELLNAEGQYRVNPLRNMLLEKAYQLFDFVDVHGATYSMDRRRKMNDIYKLLY